MDSTQAPKPSAESSAAPVASSSPDTPTPAAKEPLRLDCPPDRPEDCLSMGINAFGIELYQSLADGDENLLLSPASVFVSLSIGLFGAKNRTAEQMASVLHLRELPEAQTTLAWPKLIDSWNQVRPSVVLKTATGTFVDNSTPLESLFVRKAREQFHSPVSSMDFVHGPEAVRSSVNRWASQRTAGKVPEILPAGAIDKETRLILLSSLYFKGAWKTRFQPSATRDETFHCGSSESKVPMMKQMGRLSYAHPAGIQIVRLAYRGEEQEMVLLVPDAPNGLRDVEKQLTGPLFESWLQSTREVYVDLWLPRFQVACESLRLKGPLKKLGIEEAFEKYQADFSGIAPITDTQRLYLQEVYHQGYLEVNEQGTEAAAASAASLGNAFAGGMTAHEVHLDHPFAFAILESSTGTVLFLGRVLHLP